MTPRIAARLPWALLALDLLLVALNLLLAWLLHPGPGFDNILVGLLSIPTFVGLVAVGALIASRRPANRFGWLLIGVGLSWEVAGLATAYATYSFAHHGGDLFASHFALWLRSWLFYTNLCLIVTFIPLLFPSGRLPSPRWRPVFWLAVAGTVCTSLGFALDPTRLVVDGLPGSTGIANPFGPNQFLGVSRILMIVGFPLSILGGLVAGASIVWRLRHTRGIEHQQLKWIAYAGALVASIFAVDTVLFIFDAPLAHPIWIVQMISFAAFPIAIGIAIFRYQLFDIDRLINRTLVYGLLSLSLVMAYLLLILLSSSIVRAGSGRHSGLAVAASTLAVAALFRPLRGRIQSGVDRRFYRRRYDATRTVEAFSARLHDTVDLQTLTAELHAVVDDTMQPAHVSLWLRAPE